MILDLVIVGLSLLLGLHVGATWPWLAFWLRHPSRTRRMESPMHIPGTSPTRRTVVALAWLQIATSVATGVLAVGMIVQRANNHELSRDVGDYQSCEARYQQRFAAAYHARAAASIEVTKAMDAVVRAVAAQDPGGFKTAVAHYLNVREHQTKEREQNPLPPFPAKLCGPAPTED